MVQGLMIRDNCHRRGLHMVVCAAVLALVGHAAWAGDANDPFSGLADPTRPFQRGVPAAKVVKERAKEDLVVTSIVISPTGRRATINGTAVGVGETVGGARVVEVLPYQVVLERDGRPLKLSILSAPVTGSVEGKANSNVR